MRILAREPEAALRALRRRAASSDLPAGSVGGSS